MGNPAAFYLIESEKLMNHKVHPETVVQYIQKYNPPNPWLNERRKKQKRLPQSLPQVLKHQAQSTLWRFFFEERLDDAVDFVEPVTLQDWIQFEIMLFEENPQTKRSSYLPMFVHDYLLKENTGITPWVSFERASAVNHDLEIFYSDLSQTLQQRIDYVFDGKGSPQPPEYNIPIIDLNGIHALWVFFTRQELEEMAPTILAAIEDPKKDVLYAEEWRDILSAHERYNPITRTNYEYDLVALFAMD